MPLISAFLVGVLFAVGLGISGMTQPNKVIGFLDFFGRWQPALMFVMGGATTLYFFFFRFARGYAPLLAGDFSLPTRSLIDARLIIGSGMFGVGWGIAGFCPGPAIASLSTGTRDVLIFVAAMAAGMYLFVLIERIRSRSASTVTSTVSQ